MREKKTDSTVLFGQRSQSLHHPCLGLRLSLYFLRSYITYMSVLDIKKIELSLSLFLETVDNPNFLTFICYLKKRIYLKANVLLSNSPICVSGPVYSRICIILLLFWITPPALSLSYWFICVHFLLLPQFWFLPRNNNIQASLCDLKMSYVLTISWCQTKYLL